MERLGTVIGLGNDFQEAVSLVQLADALGYESAWITDGVGRDAFVVLTAFAGATAQITLGTSIVTFYPRHPTVMARQALSLDEVSAGRFVLGIGTGHRSSMETQLGYQMGDAVAATREYVDVLRQVFTTGRAVHHGEFWNVDWSYPIPRPRQLKIVLAALNPPLMELSGEIADGVVLWMASDSYVRDVVVPRVTAGRARVGQSLDGFDIIAPIPVAITDDVETAGAQLRTGIARSGSQPFYRREYLNAGFKEEVAEMDALRARGGDPSAAVSDRLADAMGKVGSKAEVRACIQRFRDAGANLPVLRPIYEPATERTLREAIGA
ncbi:MAG: LLM class flavin-dependent oxidoreductase [Chloroflexi bacterium]|nr:LLM class flavin-dependent oxidoreductase [Chloroflexota bacterium]MBV9597880.1 LLM class flavin-dependent oxidoreductase [Chloroflexota bacterium]